MENKEIIKTAVTIVFSIVVAFIFYLIFIKPHVTGTYVPKEKDCKNAYNCVCIGESCMCTYSKWFIENKMTCSKKSITEEQLQKR